MDNNFDSRELLLRAVLPISLYWKDGRLSSAAFKDKNGLSVSRTYERNLNIAVESMRSFFTGDIISVSVENCNSVNACVKYLPSQTNKYHCEIHRSDTVRLLSDFQAKHLASVAIKQFSCSISTT